MSENKSRKKQLSAWFTNFRRVAKKSLTHNFHTKVLSLALAFIVWPIVMVYTNPMRTRLISDVVVRIIGEDVFNNSLGYALVENVGVRTVNIDVSIQQEDWNNLNPASVEASIDLSRITELGEQDLNIVATTQSGTILKCTPDKVKVNVERRKNKVVPVYADKKGELTDGYREIETPVVSPSTLNIWGAESLVNSIQSALVELDYSTLAGSNYDYMLSDDIVLVDANKNPVKSDSLTVTNGINVTVRGRVLPTAYKPIQISENNFDGEPPDGYYLRMMPESTFDQITESDYDELLIAAPQNVLDSISFIDFDPIDVSGKTESFRASGARLHIQDGVEWVERNEISVMVVIAEEQTTRAFDNVDLTVKGLKTGMIAEFEGDTRVRVEITAGRIHLSMLPHDQVIAEVDLSDYNTAGTYVVPVEFSIRPDLLPDLTNGVIRSTPDTVTVTIRSEEMG